VYILEIKRKKKDKILEELFSEYSSFEVCFEVSFEYLIYTALIQALGCVASQS